MNCPICNKTMKFEDVTLDDYRNDGPPSLEVAGHCGRHVTYFYYESNCYQTTRYDEEGEEMYCLEFDFNGQLIGIVENSINTSMEGNNVYDNQDF